MACKQFHFIQNFIHHRITLRYFINISPHHHLHNNPRLIIIIAIPTHSKNTFFKCLLFIDLKLLENLMSKIFFIFWVLTA